MPVLKPVDSPLREALTGTSGTGVPSDPERFDSFVHERYEGLLRFLMHRTGSFQDAEDVAQESMAKLLRYRESKPASDWPRLLYRIAVNAAHDKFRDVRHQVAVAQVVAQDGEITFPAPGPDEFVVRQRKLARLRAAILRLPPKCRRVCLLRLALGMSNAQIARRCGISGKMVEKHLSKGLAALRREVGNSPADSFKSI